jgi:ribosomal protein L37AE/L43A
MSLDRKRPKHFRKAPVTEYRCQFCHEPSQVAEWKANASKCPKCGRLFDAATYPGLEFIRGLAK